MFEDPSVLWRRIPKKMFGQLIHGAAPAWGTRPVDQLWRWRNSVGERVSHEFRMWSDDLQPFIYFTIMNSELFVRLTVPLHRGWTVTRPLGLLLGFGPKWTGGGWRFEVFGQGGRERKRGDSTAGTECLETKNKLFRTSNGSGTHL